jgi:hypothetical protein
MILSGCKEDERKGKKGVYNMPIKVYHRYEKEKEILSMFYVKQSGDFEIPFTEISEDVLHALITLMEKLGYLIVGIYSLGGYIDENSDLSKMENYGYIVYSPDMITEVRDISHPYNQEIIKKTLSENGLIYPKSIYCFSINDYNFNEDLQRAIDEIINIGMFSVNYKDYWSIGLGIENGNLVLKEVLEVGF